MKPGFELVKTALRGMTDADLVQLHEAVEAEMNERVVLADSGPMEGD